MVSSYDASDLPFRLLRALLVSTGVLLSALLGSSSAQVQTALTPDGTLGTAISPRGTLFDITGGTRHGPNLFHSFDRFSVGTGHTANFTSEQTGITNILSRVTGGQRSDIDGTLRTDGQLRAEGAHLYLLNPAGVVFGANARLDVTGSFHVSTADYLRLADGARFSARLSETSTLSVAPPVAFGFLGPTPAPITVQGSTLEVPEGQTVSVVGGEVQIAGGTLRAPSGQIQIASVAAAGEVRPVTTGPAPDLHVDSVARLGRIELSQNALVDGSGSGGGTVRIRGGHLVVDSSSIATNNWGLMDGAGLGVDLQITTEAVFTHGARITADSLGAGRAGDLQLSAGQVHLEQGAQIGSTAFGPGQGGTVKVMATDTLSLAGIPPTGLLPIGSGIFTIALGQTAGAGNAGSVIVEAPRIALTAGARIGSLTGGPGQGGSVRVRATDTLSLSGTSADGTPSSGNGTSAPLSSAIGSAALGTGPGTGNAGDVVVEAPRVALTAGAQIASETFGPGHGGTVQVIATDTLTLAGISSTGSVNELSGANARIGGIFANAEGTGAGAGNAGSVVVQAPRVVLTAGAQIGSETFGPGHGGTVQVIATDTLALSGFTPIGLGIATSGIFAGALGQAAGAGDAGSVIVEAPRIALTAGARIASDTRGPGQGGTVRVTAAGPLTLSGTHPLGPSNIGASAQGQEVGAGDAGAVVVEARTVQIADGAQISSSTLGPGQGGTVSVTTADVLTIVGRTSGLRTTATGSGRGGDITVQAQQARLTAGAVISAESAGEGNAGSIALTVRDTFLSQYSTVTTEASQGKGGNIRVTAPVLVHLQNSQVTATVGGGAGDGGNVTIDPAFIVLQGSQITANAFAGNGGRISLTASKALLADPSTAITATSTLGLNGQVNIQAPVTSISGAVAPLPQAFAQTAELLRSRCVERLREGTVSRFVIGGRDGVPLEPGSLLPSPLAQTGQAGVVHGEEQGSYNPEALHGWVGYAQAQAPEGLEVECARWRGQPRPPVTPKRRR